MGAVCVAAEQNVLSVASSTNCSLEAETKKVQ
jgi:hypothetical protein